MRMMQYLELAPSCTSFSLQQNLARLKRFAVAVGLAQTSVDDRCALLAFAVGIGACVERVLEH